MLIALLHECLWRFRYPVIWKNLFIRYSGVDLRGLSAPCHIKRMSLSAHQNTSLPTPTHRISEFSYRHPKVCTRTSSWRHGGQASQIATMSVAFVETGHQVDITGWSAAKAARVFSREVFVTTWTTHVVTAKHAPSTSRQEVDVSTVVCKSVTVLVWPKMVCIFNLLCIM